MPDNSSERRRHRLELADAERTRRKVRRAKADAKLRADLDAARASGRSAAAWWASPFGIKVGTVVKGGKERPAVVRSGSVEMVNPPACEYDYRVEVDVDHTGPVITELAAIRRADGPNIGRRQMQKEPVGWVCARAVALLSDPVISKGSTQELLRGERQRKPGEPKDREQRDEELAIVAAADADARTEGTSIRKLTMQRLEAAGFPASESTVKVLRRDAVKRGLIESRPGGRPRAR